MWRLAMIGHGRVDRDQFSQLSILQEAAVEVGQLELGFDAVSQLAGPPALSPHPVYPFSPFKPFNYPSDPP